MRRFGPRALGPASSTSGSAGHAGSLRGLPETGGQVGVCPANGTSPTPGTFDELVQASLASTNPARMNSWYGFGRGEQLYYAVVGDLLRLAASAEGRP